MAAEEPERAAGAALVQLAESLGFVFYETFTWDQEVLGMGYDAGRNRKSEVLFFTAGPRNGVLWDLGVANVLRHKRLARRKGEHEVEAARPRKAHRRCAARRSLSACSGTSPGR